MKRIDFGTLSFAAARLSLVAIVAGVATLASSGANAQDMTFSMDDARSTAPPEGPPSPALQEADTAYEDEDYEAAAVLYRAVADGKTREPQGNAQRAEFFLGKSLYRMKYYQAALVVFDRISAAGPGHRYFDGTLEWLGSLSAQLPETSNIAERVGRYGVGALEAFREPAPDLYNGLSFLMGRYLYDRGQFQEAIDVFNQIPETSEHYVPARFFEGIGYVRMHKSRPAISALRAVLHLIDSGSAKVADGDRLRSLAWMSLARLYYTAANQTEGEEGDLATDGQLLGQSVEAWARVGAGSEYWLDSLFESSWAFFLSDEYARALGNVHTLNSPYFPKSYYPESLVIKAVTFFVNCQVDNAEATVGQFHQKYDPVREELEAVLAQHEDNVAFFEFLRSVQDNKASLSPSVYAVVSTALRDRTLLRHAAYVDSLDQESKRLESATAQFRDSAVGEFILEEVSLARSFAVDAAGELARSRYNRLLRELQDLGLQVDTVELEIATYQRGQIGQEMQEQMTLAKSSKGGDVLIDQEHQLWPFDGEYWRDELGFYRQQVTNVCGR